MTAQSPYSLPVLLLFVSGCSATAAGAGADSTQTSLAPPEAAAPADAEPFDLADPLLAEPAVKYIAAGPTTCEATCAEAGLSCRVASGSPQSAVATVFTDPFDSPGQAVDNSALLKLLPATCDAPLPPPSAATPAQSLMCICSQA